MVELFSIVILFVLGLVASSTQRKGMNIEIGVLVMLSLLMIVCVVRMVTVCNLGFYGFIIWRD